VRGGGGGGGGLQACVVTKLGVELRTGLSKG